MNGPRVAVIGGGLAGIAAALECADRGSEVTLVERRRRLGGLTWSFRHGEMWVDNGQHVFLRCCTEYIDFLRRTGASADVAIQDRLDVPVVAPDGSGGPPAVGRLRRSALPAPLHLAASLLRYPHVGLADRLRLGAAVGALLRLRLDDPQIDEQTFGEWLRAHRQSAAAVAAVWDLITVPTVNLPAAEASLAMGAKVFKTGLLEQTEAADIGWSRVPLGRLHGEHSSAALSAAGVKVRTGERVLEVWAAGEAGAPVFEVRCEDSVLDVDRVVVAVPHEEAAAILPAGAIPHQERLTELGASAVVDVHLVYDRAVTSWPVMAAVNSPVQWIFDRTASAGISGDSRQYLAVSVSAADGMLGMHPDDLVASVAGEIPRLLPAASTARVLDSLVTKERKATFAARPGTAALRPGPSTRIEGLAIAGAWTDTGWPATMEGAVRSGRAAGRACLARARSTTPVTLKRSEHPDEEVA